ncbi:MAG: DNA internalization-related competence protein ComEC/Rec2 [Gammaproteobacteria bacterium]|nr:MAG: DNA internalization-related competence protein ComEC/Rec2 [Gammaproteobacteria bacterium]
MRTGCVLFVIGALILLQLRELPSLYPLLLPLLLLALAARRYPAVRWVLWLGAGFCWCLFRAGLLLDSRLDPALEGAPLTIEGRIEGLPVCRDDVCRFVFKTERLLKSEKDIADYPERVRISWYEDPPEILPGQRWRLHVKLKRPWGSMNPGGFDYEGWLFRQGVRATGYVVARGDNRKLEKATPYSVAYLRHLITERMTASIYTPLPAALLPALVIGDSRGMEDEHWAVLNRTGTTHLLVISGQHIALIAAMAFFLVRLLWARSGILPEYLAAPRAAAIAALFVACAYAALAGFSVPTRRALIMTAAVLAEPLFSRRLSRSHVFCLALLLVTALDPLDVLAPGFWLSFGAVGLILYGMSHRVDVRGIWWRWGRTQFVVALGLAPLLVVWFGQIPLTGLAANLIAVPWVSLVTLPLTLGGVALLPVADLPAGFFLWGAGMTLEWLWRLLEWFAAVGPGVLAVPPASMIALIFATIAVLVLLAPRGLTGRWLGWFCLLPLVSPGTLQLSEGEFSLTLLDVGQGLAAAIRTRHHLVLYDTGPRYSEQSNAGEEVILPWLRQMGKSRIDLLFVSHGDADHAGGLPALLEGLEIGTVLSSIPEQIKHDRNQPCEMGQHWRLDGVDLEVLSPVQGHRMQGNNASCVLKVGTGDRSVLLTGDIERPVEQFLVRNQGAKLAAMVLVAPHHGSASSSSRTFIETVGARYVLISAGYRNRFGLPNRDIIARYRAAGAMPVSTVRSGAITLDFRATGIGMTEYRRIAGRFWHTRDPAGD